MKRTFISARTMLAAPAALLLFAIGALPVRAAENAGAGAAAPGTVAVNIDPRLRYQTVEGWGSSLCWWAANVVGKWKNEKKVDEVIDLITSPDKLNMNIFRYNIGGGDDPSHYSTPGHPGHMAQKGGKGVRAEMEGFKASESAPYDWTRDKGQIGILLKIRQKRPDAIFEAFSNSPPYWMTYSGCSAGNDPGGTDNLKPEYYDAYCDYLVAVCKHFKDKYGIEFHSLEPFNESSGSNWHYLGSQEGCHYDLSTQIEIIKRLYPRLQKAGLKTVISASDESKLSFFIAMLNAYISDGKVLDYVGQLNTHTYAGTDAQRVIINGLVDKIGKPLWQSETGGPSAKENFFTNNLKLGQRCISDMRLMKPVAWIDWQAVEGNDIWGLIINSKSGDSYSLGKNFYVRMQITRFIRQGYTIIDTDQENTLAALSPSGKELVICFINVSGKDETVRCNLSWFASSGPAAVYVTSATQDCERGAAISASGGGVSGSSGSGSGGVVGSGAGSGGILEFPAPNLTITTLVVPVILKQ